jgi:hypothetical protein
LLGFTVQRLRDGGLDDEQVRAALDLLLTAPHSRGGGYPIAGPAERGSSFERLTVTA